MTAVGPNTRASVLERDGWRCVYCGEPHSRSSRLTMDHVVPQSIGGRGTLDNLVAACLPCNSLRGDGPPLPTREGYGRDLRRVYVDQLHAHALLYEREKPGGPSDLRRLRYTQAIMAALSAVQA